MENYLPQQGRRRRRRSRIACVRCVELSVNQAQRQVSSRTGEKELII